MQLDNNKKYLVKFIDCYRNHPPLWDNTSPEYMNKHKKIAGYNDLLEILKKLKSNATVDDVRKKINTLRSCYRRESKKMAESMGTNKLYEPTVWWFHLFDFIQCLDKSVTAGDVKPRNLIEFANVQMNDMNDEDDTAGNVKPRNLIEFENVQMDDEDDIAGSVKSRNLIEYANVQTSDEDDTAGNVKRRNLIKLANAHISDVDEESSGYKEIYEPPKSKKVKQSILEETLTSSPIKEYDSYDYLAKVWADKLRKISSTQRVFVEKAINDVFFEAEMGTLKRGSVKINEPMCTIGI